MSSDASSESLDSDDDGETFTRMMGDDQQDDSGATSSGLGCGGGSGGSGSSGPGPAEGKLHGPDYDDDGKVAPLWSPQDAPSTCEFTWPITGYAGKRESGCKKAEYSEVCPDPMGNKWRLIIYVNGNGKSSNNHLSLFLQVADSDGLPFGWSKSVSYILTLQHPTSPNLHYAKRNPDKTFKLCPKAIDWGWSQFVTSDRIWGEGFVKDDSLVVKAVVTVKSSSVDISPSDSEVRSKERTHSTQGGWL